MIRNNDNGQQQKGRDDEEKLAHVPPEVGQAEVDRARDLEKEIKPPEEPIQQYREGPRRRKRHPA